MRLPRIKFLFTNYKMPRRPRPRRARRARRVRRARIPRGVAPASRIQNKVYTYKFKREPIYLTNWVPPTGGVGVQLTPTPPSPGLVMTVSGLTTSSIPFSGHFDFGLTSTFSLADISNVGVYTGMYDQYKLLGVKVIITYLQNTAEAQSQAIMPTLNIVSDQDDSNMPSSVVQLLGKQGSRRFTFGSKGRTSFSMYFRPNVVQQVGVAAGNLGIAKSMWLDCVSETIPHYALKAYFENVYIAAPQGVSTAFKIDLEYKFAFKQPLQCS